jgi:hypothetical protein
MTSTPVVADLPRGVVSRMQVDRLSSIRALASPGPRGNSKRSSYAVSMYENATFEELAMGASQLGS